MNDQIKSILTNTLNPQTRLMQETQHLVKKYEHLTSNVKSDIEKAYISVMLKNQLNNASDANGPLIRRVFAECLDKQFNQQAQKNFPSGLIFYLDYKYGEQQNHLPKLKKQYPLTFCIGTCNNLNYLKLAIHSVRTYSYFKDAPFIVYSENADDGTNEWLVENKEKYNLTTIIEHNEIAKGIGVGMNITAAQVKTKYIMFLHADMFVSKNWDLECLKLFEKYPNEKLWINPYRFQPNCWQEQNRFGTQFFDYDVFGYKADDFNEQYFIDYAEEFSKLNPDIEIPKGEGVSGLIRKSDWDNLGGNDPQFIAYYDDADIFLRARLSGYKFIITSNSVVFHFGSRSDKSNFPTDEIVRSDRSKLYEMDSRNKFIKKWGFLPINDEYGFVNFPPNIEVPSISL